MQPFPQRPQPQLLFHSNHASLSPPPQTVTQGFIGPQTGRELSIFYNDLLSLIYPLSAQASVKLCAGLCELLGAMQDQPSQQPACSVPGLHHFWVSFLHLELHPGPAGRLSPPTHTLITPPHPVPPPPATNPDIQPGLPEMPNRKYSSPAGKHSCFLSCYESHKEVQSGGLSSKGLSSVFHKEGKVHT